MYPLLYFEETFSVYCCIINTFFVYMNEIWILLK